MAQDILFLRHFVDKVELYYIYLFKKKNRKMKKRKKDHKFIDKGSFKMGKERRDESRGKGFLKDTLLSF